MEVCAWIGYTVLHIIAVAIAAAVIHDLRVKQAEEDERWYKEYFGNDGI